MMNESFEVDVKHLLTMLIDEYDNIAAINLNRETPVAQLISRLSHTGEYIYTLTWRFTDPYKHKKFINRVLTGSDRENIYRRVLND